MNTKYELASDGERQIVYVRPVKVAELPDEIRSQIIGKDEIYAVHSEDGERLALVKDRRLAFILANQNHMAPVNVH